MAKQLLFAFICLLLTSTIFIVIMYSWSITGVYSWFPEGKELLMVHIVQDSTFRTPSPNRLRTHHVYCL